LKQAFLLVILAFVAGCGGGKAANPINPQLSKLKQRAFVLNQYTSQIEILDSLHDVVFPTPINVNAASPQRLNKIGKVTLVTSPNSNVIQTVDDVNEITGTPFSLEGNIDSLVVSTTSAFAAISSAGAVAVVNFSNGSVNNVTVQPLVRRVAISHSFAKVLSFADNDNSIVVINTADNTTTTVNGFDRPYTAVFSADDSKAYVLNCGAECGGTASSVSVLDIASGTITTTVPVPGGATVGYSDGTNLYVAGNSYTGSTFNGSFVTPVGLSSLTAGTAVPIGFGLHTLMVPTSNNKIYIGAQNCVNPAGTSPANSGCLSIFTPSSGSVTVNPATNSVGGPSGDVTGMALIPNRTVMYVAVGGELVIYDINADAPLPLQNQLDFIGKIVDVEEVD